MAEDAERVEVVEILGAPSDASPSWRPVAGIEVTGLMERVRLPPDEKPVVMREAASVLQRCPMPSGPDESATGLVIGYVQSGKTMNFTTVAAYGRDNGYPIIIVIGGTSLPLFHQSEERLRDDLGLRKRYDRQWRHFSNPGVEARSAFESVLQDWKDPRVPGEERQTLLITVMKHHQRLAKLNELLDLLELRGMPVLVIDDEGDHAGLNTLVARQDMSITYRRLIELRQQLPHHGYLLYTATPQAPLLINIIDAMSPDFAVLLTPGCEYTGGVRFFDQLEGRLVRTIPASEIVDHEDADAQPPETLLDAMRVFFVGVAAGMRDHRSNNRSMMIHPSQYRQSHAQHKRWVDQIRTHWDRLSRQPEDEPARVALLEEFRQAHADLAATVSDLPAFEELASILPRAIMRTNVELINSGPGRKTPNIDWHGNYAWILVGGQAMDRGFTVEGLTVTYMPRGVGVGNADAIQQRARFFGYKEGYIGYCRVYLEAETRRAYNQYVEHEDALRRQLGDHGGTGKSLMEWKRAFFLSQELRPTRHNVLDLDYVQSGYSDKWFSPEAPHASYEATQRNRALAQAFLGSLALAPDPANYPRPSQRHFVAKHVPLRDALGFLVDLQMPALDDSLNLTGVLLQLSRHLESNPGATCDVYRMSTMERGARSADEEGKVPNIFMGAYPSTGPLQGSIYPGDRHLHPDGRVAVQVHEIEVQADGQPPIPGVIAVGVWLPRQVAGDWLVQHPPGGTRRA